MSITLNWTTTVTRDTAFENIEEQYKVGTWSKDGVEKGAIEVLLDTGGVQTLSDDEIIEGLDRPWLT